MQPIVVKLGGSLYDTPELKIWLTTLAEYAKKQPVILVPGGGPFADNVRTAQALHNFDDKTAHHMALLAMKQFGLVLIGLAPNCQPFSIDNPKRAPFSVWLPDDSLLLEPSIEQSWSISSDSLALWLTQHVSAQQLLLIKRTKINSQSIKKLIEQDILDKGFAHTFVSSPIAAKIIHYQNHLQLNAISSTKQHNLSLT